MNTAWKHRVIRRIERQLEEFTDGTEDPREIELAGTIIPTLLLHLKEVVQENHDNDEELEAVGV